MWILFIRIQGFPLGGGPSGVNTASRRARMSSRPAARGTTAAMAYGLKLSRQ